MELDSTTRLIIIVALILSSAYFSIAEISLAASSKIRMQQLIEQRKQKSKTSSEIFKSNLDRFFSVIQIGVNAIAILGGIVGETVFSPFFEQFFLYFCAPDLAASLGFFCSFFAVTMIFVLFADLIPKRIGLNKPEKICIAFNRLNAILDSYLEAFRYCIDGPLKFLLKSYRSSDKRMRPRLRAKIF